MLVVDLQHWLLPNGDLDPRARLAPHVALVVECATSGPGIDGPIPTSMVCRHRGSRRRCQGLIDLHLLKDAIDWHCSACDDGGLISGWARSRWDLSDTELIPDDAPLAVFVTVDELRVLRDLELPRATRAVLASAPLVEVAHASLELTEAELVVLMHAVLEADVRGRRRSRLDVAFGRLEQVRIAHQLARRVLAH